MSNAWGASWGVSWGVSWGASELADTTFNARDRIADTDFDVEEGTGVAFETK